jgi:hypothetical protein
MISGTVTYNSSVCHSLVLSVQHSISGTEQTKQVSDTQTYYRLLCQKSYTEQTKQVSDTQTYYRLLCQKSYTEQTKQVS